MATPTTTATMPSMRDLIRTGFGVPIGVLAVFRAGVDATETGLPA